MQTAETFATAKQFIIDSQLVNPGRQYALWVGQMLVTGFLETDSRSDTRWFHIVRTTTATDPEASALILFHEEDEEWRDYRRAFYLVDDGAAVTPYYVAGWNVSGRFLILHEIRAQSRTPYLASLATPCRCYSIYLAPMNR